MDRYTVKLYKKAHRDIEDIFLYISREKLSQKNTKEQADRIKSAVLCLDQFPQTHQERQEGKYANKYYRQLLIDNYDVIFRIDEEMKIVFVVTVQYRGRNV